MLKFLLLLALAGIVWLAWKKNRQSGAGRPPAQRPVEDMVTCAHCGVHLPATESVSHGGRHYCCAAHRDQGPAPTRP